MRSAWNTRRAGLPAAKRAGVGMLRLMTSTSSQVVVNGVFLRVITMPRAIDLAYRSSP